MKVFLICSLLIASMAAFSETPQETYMSGGSGVGFGNGGVASDELDLSLMEVNPALLAKKRAYIFSGALTSPDRGRSFYDVGVLDSHTSDLAIGIKGRDFASEQKEGEEPTLFSPVKRRFAASFARKLSSFYAGLTLNYAQSEIIENKKRFEVEVYSLGVGLYGEFENGFSFGVSWQNLQNRGYDQVSPYTFRAGVSYTPIEPLLISLDYVSYEDSAYYEGNKGEMHGFVGPAFKYRVFGGFNLVGSAKAGVSGSKFRRLSGGVSYSYESLSLSYYMMTSEYESEYTSTASLSYTARSF